MAANGALAADAHHRQDAGIAEDVPTRGRRRLAARDALQANGTLM